MASRNGAALDARHDLIPAAQVLASQRLLSLDVGRGIAVLIMIFAHLVPVEGATTFLGQVWANLVRCTEADAAALFCVPVGMTVAIQSQRVQTAGESGSIVRRALVLAVGGIAMHVMVWPTEILLTLGLMMLVTSVILRKGIKALVCSSVLILIAVPATSTWLGHYALTDWMEDGRHLGERMFGWATIRFLVFDGNYPLLPWVVFPLLGAALVLCRWDSPGRSKRCFWCCLILAGSLQILTYWVSQSGKTLGKAASHLASTWTPATIPFVLLTGTSAVTLLAGLAWWESQGGLQRAAMPVALFGRVSLTHYVLHITAVYAPLRLVWPDEDWPLNVGLIAAATYVAIALPLTALWFRRFSRGPVEMLWALASGREIRSRPDGTKT